MKIFSRQLDKVAKRLKKKKDIEIKCPKKKKAIKQKLKSKQKTFKSLLENRPDLEKSYSLKNNIEFSKLSFGSKDIVIWECNVCGYEYEREVRVISRSKLNGCPACKGYVLTDRNRFSKKHPDILEEWDYSKNNVSPEEIAYSGGNKYYWICKRCFNSWYMRLSDRTIQGKGCPECNLKQSKGSRKIEDFLIKNSISYEKEKKFDGCNYKQPLRFDFYLSMFDICIEYQGKQHYEPIEYFGGLSGFEETKIRDAIKKEFCLNNSIKLIEISYKNERKIEKILNFEIFGKDLS